jgi:hypothetical protein
VDARRQEVLRWEARWAVPAGLATFAAVILVIAGVFVIGSVSGEGEAELLRSVNEHRSSVTLEGILQALGFVLLVAPLVYLFRAAAARSDRMRYQLIGLVVAAPLFLAVSSLLTSAATNDAASQFVAGKATSTLTSKEATAKCQADLEDMGAKEFQEEFGGSGGAGTLAKCNERKVADDEATNASKDASTRGISTGFGLAGRLGLAIALLYSCLYAMRVGLLTRFWGSLGMALGVAALLLIVQFSMIFFIYLGLLLIGRLPGGKPPAWAAGKAIPWPTPGEKAAESLEASEPDPDDPPELPPANGNGDSEPGDERRKRKQRD